jgi:hypothetical protein
MKLMKILTIAVVAADAVFTSAVMAQTAGSAYAQAVLTNKPVAFWRLNETTDPSSGTLVAADASGGGFNGTYGVAAQNGFNNIAGPRPTAFPGFEASNDALQVTAGTDQAWVTAPQPALNTNTVTFTAWLYPSGDQADWTGILMDRSGDGEGMGMGGGANHGMLTYTWNNNSGATYGFVSGLTIPPDQWSFVAVVIEPTQAILYLDAAGVLTSATNAIAHINEAWGGTANIGADPTYTVRNVNGMVDEVAVFNYPMTPAQISNFYQGIAAPSTPTLSLARTANGIVLTFTGTLQSADVITGPWANATGASPLTITTSGSAKFYRAVSQGIGL